MPTNLPPEYFEIEERYRAAVSTKDKIARLEELMRVIPKHKGTDKLRADLRRRLSQLKSDAQTRKGASRQVSVYHIDPEGAGQLVLVGTPNTGKSALLAALTNATPEVADYPFTTWTPTPGMMPIDNIQIQLIDLPPFNEDYVEPAMLDLIRRSDLILLVVDIQAYPIDQIEEAIAFLEDHRIAPEHRRAQYAPQQRMSFVPLLVLVNKVDNDALDEDFEVLQELLAESWPMFSISATTGRHFDAFKQYIFERLEIVRVYSKPPGKDPNLDAPFVMRKGGTVGEFAGKVHQDFLKNLKSARVWGQDVYDGQLVGQDYVLHDGDVVELRA